MKKGKRYLLLSIFLIALSLYLSETAAAMEPEAESAETATESVSDTEIEPKAEPMPDTEPAEEPEPDAESMPDMELAEELEPDAELMPDTESMAEPEPDAESETDAEPAAPLMTASVSDAQPEPEPDGISSAAELAAWLQSHLYTGGRAKLTDDIVMDTPYVFVPYPKLPPLFVETGSHTIFVRADVEFWSDGRLTFSGEGGGQGMFHVEQGSMLLLDGVTVETADDNGSQYALWQEDGASLILGNTFAPCLVSGNVHYSDTPFVLGVENACVVVEKGQLLDGLLPETVACRVNYRGDVLEHEPMVVSWYTEGTGRQQAERLRFEAQGAFLQAAAEVEPFCTVVYNDYPLTFTRAEASALSNGYAFRGSFTGQEDALLAAVLPEYSFDGENWIREEENGAFGADIGFSFVVLGDQWDVSANPYIYIRLHGDTKEQVYYSNVLRYAAGNMDVAEDLGGSRGGGTAIVNPPGEPENPENPEKPEKPVKSDKSEKPAQTGKAEDTNKPGAENKAVEPEQSKQSEGLSKSAEPEKENSAAKSSGQSGSRDEDEKYENKSVPEQPSKPQLTVKNTGATLDFAARETPAGGETAATVEACAQPVLSAKSDIGNTAAEQRGNYGIVLCLVLLSASVGAACFFVSKGTKR